MVIFLVLFFVSTLSKRRQKTSKVDLLEEVTNKEALKKKTKAESELSRIVIQNIKMIIVLLKETLDIDYKILWEKKEVDEELFKKYTDICVRILESSFAKDDEVITSIFLILEVILKEKPELFPSIQTVLINLVYES